MRYSFQWSASLEAIAISDWQRCFDAGDALTSYALQQALERAGMVEQFHYLQVFADGALTGLVPCCVMEYPLADLAPKKVQRLVGSIQKVYRNFLRAKMFVVGSPIATCSDMLGIPVLKRGIAPAGLIGALATQIERKAASLGIAFTCLKELSPSLNQRLLDDFGNTYVVCRSPDTTYVCTAPVGELSYQQNMLSKYRNVLKKRQRDFANSGLVWRVEDDFGVYAAQMHRLYLNVLARSQTKFERLTEAFFREVNQRLGGSAYALMCFDGAHLVAFELFLKGEQLHPLYLGIDYDYREAGSLYFNCLYKIVEQAEQQGLAYIELGQTSYEPKFSIGAVSVPRYFYIKHRSALITRLLRLGKPWLFPDPVIPELRSVFKLKDQYLETLRATGVLDHAD
ncbi:GNAT family N-acetyltransferase [Pseudomonas cremoricolorata]|uniref:BioF2-like acetyltransferase domain-containing protein n=1 Tax=Pseudomonas cremoricolorata TaxID=157783 RepID=A0A089WER0_9PSED|nr:GNAT family N-acetyltransferase [Pseudomonas cremoricolorata]AIR87755.1 hypothetical protein LK03_00220 [Pseudomonas cremoricolorata]